ncbi:MAG TPA: matrixin family metalloprotease [Chthoniobacterales bacterium]|nr:matrixin family metalloprotease [Chthoniobacterales bacterium]
MPKTSLNGTVVAQRPINRYSSLDNAPVRVGLLTSASERDLIVLAGIPKEAASRLVALRRKGPLRSTYDLLGEGGISQTDLERIRRSVLFFEDPRLVITDVVPSAGRIMSERSFAIRVQFAAVASPPIFVRVEVEWAGEPFLVEKKVSARDRRGGFVSIPFGKRQTLPAGPAVFRVALTNGTGAQAKFRITCVVLPSNPFSLGLAPKSDFVTGTFSARGVRDGNAYNTSISVTLSNGDSRAVSVRQQFTWKFWDGGVGGSLVEQGTGGFPDPIAVPAFGTWGGWIAFHSPQGSGVFNKYDGKEDMTIEIIMTRTDGTQVSGTITCRTMFRFGVNVTQVAFEDFFGQEGADLDAAAEVTRTIYERRDITFDTDDRGINRARAGPFENITSESEARDLWEQWSGPNSNNNIDAFVVDSLAIPISGGGTADGLDGDIPGPTSHAGRNSGTVQNKSGFVDSSGAPRLHVEYLGMLMGHELGHYLGLSHTSDAGNLMLPSSGTTDTNLTYEQYRKMIRHGWVSID